MEPILFLTHRIPFPPNKGDKVRSFHLLKFLAQRFRVHLGTFVDDAADRQFVARLDEYCASSKVVEIHPALARIKSLTGFWTGEALTLSYYRDAALAAWVRDTVVRYRIRSALVFSSAMAQYIADIKGLRTVVDFVDVDSAKWEQYGRTRPWPLSAVYEREGDRLLSFERSVAKNTDASVFVTRGEADLFRKLAPESASRVSHAANGVDTDFFSPASQLPNPFPSDEEPIVFTGAMDYWPNIDAVCWFAREILPTIVSSRPNARFYVVGMQPSPAVLELAKDARIIVTGRVDDVRPYLQHARVVVAPVRVARGIQNKVLEAMAMGRPVVVSAPASVALSAEPGKDFAVAADAALFAAKTLDLMDIERGRRVGAAGRARVVADYDWAVNLAPFIALLDGAVTAHVDAGD